jgi:hypothetical protein
MLNFKIFILLLILFFNGKIFAFGTYSEGWASAKIIQFESRGLIFESYEGLMELSTFSSDEKCDEEKDECYTITKQKIPFSVRPENAETVNLLMKSLNQDLVIKYRIHRIEAIALSSETEVIEALATVNSMPTELESDKLIVSKTGAKRNFSVSGKILRLEYQGTMIGTYEGLYVDELRGRVHPFSITDEKMANYAWITMKSNMKSNLGISVAFATGFRKSNYDLFEINYKAPAGGVYK